MTLDIQCSCMYCCHLSRVWRSIICGYILVCSYFYCFLLCMIMTHIFYRYAFARCRTILWARCTLCMHVNTLSLIFFNIFFFINTCRVCSIHKCPHSLKLKNICGDSDYTNYYLPSIFYHSISYMFIYQFVLDLY